MKQTPHRYVPNILSISRLCAGPVVAGLILGDFFVVAAAFFMVAAVTDFYDGYFARKYSIESQFGSFLDPLADKVLVISALGALAVQRVVPIYIVILVCLRDLLVTTLRSRFLTRKKPFTTSLLAKSKTALQLVVISYLLLCAPTTPLLAQLLLGSMGALTLWSGIDYVWCLVPSSFVTWCARIVATGGGVGLSPFAPGTLASIVAWWLYVFLWSLSTVCSWVSISFFVTLLVAISFWATEYMLHLSKTKDPGWIVIDEMLAVWFLCPVFAAGSVWQAVAVGLFRFFDISKLGGVKKVEKLPNAWGVLGDDILAAILAILLVLAAKAMYYNLFLKLSF